MPYSTLNLGIALTLPTNGTRNWGTQMRSTTWTKISQHDHTGSGNGAQIPSGGLADRAVTSAKLALNHGDVQASTVTPVGITATLDFANGRVQFLDLGSASGDVTVTLSNPVAGGKYTILVQQGATPRDIIWPASVKWPQAQKLLLSQTDDAVDKVELRYDSANSCYYADWDQGYSA